MKNSAVFLITFFTIISVNTKILSQSKNIEITSKRNPDKSVDISYKKELPGSYFVKLNFTTIENCHQSANFESVIKNNSGFLVKLTPVNSERAITYSYKYTYIRGVPNPKIDSLISYTIPLKKGNKVKINEASNVGEKYFGSERPTDWKSYIIYRNQPDTIYSMRKGIVVEIENSYTLDTLHEKSYTSKRNTVIIEHPDGTYASYAGFKKNSIVVKLGQTVYPQTKLGVMEVFNTGTYRLSFAVYYLNNLNTDTATQQNLKDQVSRNSFLTPYFITENGVEKLKPGIEYTATTNEEILFQELTKKEKKEYSKNPEIFD